MRRALTALVIGTALLAPDAGTTRVARAAEGTEIASAADPGNPFDLFFGVDYAFEAKRAAVKREDAGFMGADPNGGIPIVKDLVYQQNRHIITPHMQIGVFHDLELHFSLPIVVSDTRDLRFDQRSSPCIFGGDPMGRKATCINAGNSTTFRDHLLNDNSASGGGLGFDAHDPGTNFAADSKTVFRGVDRSGVDVLWMGLAWAPMNQEKDDTKPTWVIGADFGISIGKIMKFNRMNPGSEDGVSEGYHQFKAYTSLSRRTSWSEPFATFYWKTPMAMRGTTPPSDTSPTGDGSQYWDTHFGQRTHYPQQQAGVIFGFEAIPWENVKQKQKLAIQFRANIAAHFEGRGYGEMWEVFSYAGDAQNNPGGPLVLDRDPTSASDMALSHPGVTDIENFMTFAGRLAVRGWVGKNAKFSAAFDVSYDQRHRISWTDAGKDLNNSGIVDPGTNEVNPLHKDVIDTVGRRYLVDESFTFTFLVSGTVMF